jgi:hypothetical protein
MSRCMMTLMAAFAEMEREMIVGRVIGGVRKAQADGKHCGRPRRVFRRDRLLELKAGWQILGGNQPGIGSAGRHPPQRPAKRPPVSAAVSA